MRNPDHHARDNAAVDLAGYLLSMIRFNEIPSHHLDNIKERVAAVRQTQGTDTSEAA